MKNTIKRLTLAAAFLAVASGVASAQVMKADIPFAFRAGDQMMPPGSYRVQVADTNRLVILLNADRGPNAILLPISAADASRDWKAKGDPVLAFECAGRCSLVRVWTGNSSPALNLPHRGSGGEAHAALTLIRLARTNGD